VYQCIGIDKHTAPVGIKHHLSKVRIVNVAGLARKVPPAKIAKCLVTPQAVTLQTKVEVCYFHGGRWILTSLTNVVKNVLNVFLASWQSNHNL